MRGWLLAISKLNWDVITCSAGNDGKGVAYAAREAGIRATICVSRSVDRSKLDAMVRMGADVRVSEFDGYDETQDWALEIAAREERYFLPAFADDAVMGENGGAGPYGGFVEIPE